MLVGIGGESSVCASAPEAGDWARLSGSGWSVWVSQFDFVRADSSNGGTDTKDVEAVDFLMVTDGAWSDV